MRRLTEELDSQEWQFGSGWISGMLALALSLVGLGTVSCFCFPQLLTVDAAREFYATNVGVIRVLLQLVLVAAFVMALVSATLRKSTMLGFVAMTIVLIATLMGGSKAATISEVETDWYLGLDFFFLNFVFLGAIFIPIERLLKKNEQPILRYEWREDLLYFLISTIFVQMLAYLSLNPSLTALAATESFGWVRDKIASQHVLIQFFEIMFLTDLAQYWFHRTFHKIPWLWKFHAVHHSAQAMDWLAGSRMHIVEVLLMRSFTTLPMYVMGFGETALYAYIFFVYLLSVFIHANIRVPFGFLQYIIATPRFHHWHHGIEEEAIDVNFAIHFPLIDMVFGTFHLPDGRWPEGYGVGGHPVPNGFLRQLVYPFQRSEESIDEPD